MYTRIRGYLYVYLYVYVNVYVIVYVNDYVWVSVYVPICLRLCICVFLCVQVHVCIHTDFLNVLIRACILAREIERTRGLHCEINNKKIKTFIYNQFNLNPRGLLRYRDMHTPLAQHS